MRAIFHESFKRVDSPSRVNHVLFEKSVLWKFHARRRSRLLTTLRALMAILKVQPCNYNGLPRFLSLSLSLSLSLYSFLLFLVTFDVTSAFTSCDCSNVLRSAAITADSPSYYSNTGTFTREIITTLHCEILRDTMALASIQKKKFTHWASLYRKIFTLIITSSVGTNCNIFSVYNIYNIL